MKLEACTVAIRERKRSELFDLGFALCRRHAAAFATLALAHGLPMALAAHWLLAQPDPDNWSRIYPALLLADLMTLWLTTAVTVYLGHALFEVRPSMRQALALAWSRAPALLLATLIRLVCTVTVIGLLLWPTFLPECLLLERQPFRAAWKRARQLGAAGDGLTHALQSIVVALFGLIALVWAARETWSALTLGLVWEDAWWTWLNPGHALAPWLALIPIATYLAVVRYLAYINVRTQREGWEVEIGLRSAAAEFHVSGSEVA